MIAYMKILFTTSEEFIATSLLIHTSLLLPFATPSDKANSIYLMTGNFCLIYYVTASYVYKRSFTPTRSDAYEEKPRCQDLLHAFFAPNSLYLDKIGHKTLKNHKKRS